jgi:hypothetical protein
MRNLLNRIGRHQTQSAISPPTFASLIMLLFIVLLFIVFVFLSTVHRGTSPLFERQRIQFLSCSRPISRDDPENSSRESISDRFTRRILNIGLRFFLSRTSVHSVGRPFALKASQFRPENGERSSCTHDIILSCIPYIARCPHVSSNRRGKADDRLMFPFSVHLLSVLAFTFSPLHSDQLTQRNIGIQSIASSKSMPTRMVMSTTIASENSGVPRELRLLIHHRDHDFICAP